MADRVSVHPLGLGESVLYQDLEHRFRDWQSVNMVVNSGWGWKALSHLEAGKFDRPGDGPVLVGLGFSNIPAGSEAADAIYQRSATAASRSGDAWDIDPTLTTKEKFDLIQADIAKKNAALGIDGVVSWTPADYAADPTLEEQYVPEDQGFSLWGTMKGISRWGFMVFDSIPESLDAILRAADYVKQGQLSVGQAVGGYFGVNEEASRMVGIPLFQYLNDLGQGQRLNMGTGFFAEGEVANDIGIQLAMYDQETESLESYNRAVERTGGQVLVEGLGGKTYKARNFDEWQTLRNNAGRAALLNQIQSASPQQAALGQAHGTFHEGVYDEASVLRSKDKYFSSSIGRVGAAAATLEPESAPFNIVSGGLDFGKQLVDLPLIGLAKGGTKVLSRLGRFVGNGEGVGDLIRGSNTLNDIRHGVDHPAFGRFIEDLNKGTVNKGQAANALARNADLPLSNAAQTVIEARKTLPKVVESRTQQKVAELVNQGVAEDVAKNMVGEGLSLKQVNSFINRAIDGDKVAESWVRKALSEITDMTDEMVGKKLDDIRQVQARPGVDLKKGIYGKAEVADEVWQHVNDEIDHLEEMLTSRKASVVEDGSSKKLTLTFDADLGRAQATFKTLVNHLDEGIQLTERQKKVATALDTARRTLADPKIAASERYSLKNIEIPKLIEEARALGVDVNDLARTLRKPTYSLDAARQRLTTDLFNDRQTWRRWAENVLDLSGDDTDEVGNLIRVLQRNDQAGDLINGISDFRPRIEPSQLNKLLTGNGAMRDLVRSLVAAKTIPEVKAVLGPSIEFAGARTVPASFFAALKHANNETDIVQAFMELGRGVKLNPQRMTLLGNHAKMAALTTGAGAAVGGVSGAYEQYNLGGGVGDIIGGGIGGTVAGALVGSGVSGTLGTITRGANRRLDNLADAMDMLLAGTRAATTDILKARGVPMGVAQQGLGVASQVGYAFGHSPLGRRLARSAGDGLNLADPDDLFYKMGDYSKNLGIQGSEVVHVLTRGKGDAKEVARVVSSLTDDATKVADQVMELQAQGYRLTASLSVDEALTNMAQITPNNTAAGWKALRGYFDAAGHILAAKGMSDNVVDLLTRFTEQGIDEFFGNLDAMGNKANLAQAMVLQGNVHNFEQGAKMVAELWAGRVHLPPAQVVNRAVNQLDALGKVTQVFTGKGVVSNIIGEITKRDFAPEQVRSLKRALTPELEYNVAMRAARGITGTLWVPAVLLTRPLSFLSKVLGEDQFRMTASGLDSLFMHPFNYFSAVVSNYKLFRNTFDATRSMAARSLIPHELIDEFGKVRPDLLDDMNNWSAAESVQQALGIYDRKADKARRVFGTAAWTQVKRGTPSYLDGVAREFRQILADPIARRLARSTADDPIDDVYNWLLTNKEGQEVARKWAGQFTDPETAKLFMDPEVMKAFIWDEWARVNLKTGGDWVFSIKQSDGTRVVVNSRGEHLSNQNMLKDMGWDQLDDGYHIIRDGDVELLDAVRTGNVGPVTLFDEHGTARVLDEVNIGGELSEERWNAIQNLIRDRHEAFEKKVRRADYDEVGDLRFPETVKAERNLVDRRESLNTNTLGQLMDRWDAGLERTYDFWLGKRTNEFSRNPVLGNFYWERIGLLLPSMDAKTANAFMEVARKEGRSVARRVQRISEAADATPVAKGILDDFFAVDYNAKAYAVERTKDTLFDLTRQRNFIEGLRVMVPFAGPMVEALEAWARVARENPIEIWRRGTQVVDGLWSDPLDPSPSDRKLGMFWRNDKGEEMISVPYSGEIFGWMKEQFQTGPWVLDDIARALPEEGLSGRARGLNVVFGTEDLADPTQPTISGVPWAALNAGTGPVFNAAVTPLLRDREGVRGAIFRFLFPYGEPANMREAMLPYHLRKIFEGQLGEASQVDRIVTSMEQWEAMVANGRVGLGTQYEFDLSDQAGVDAAWKEAQSRGFWANLVEGIARGSLPSMVTPEMLVDGTRVPEGFNMDAAITVDAYAAEARELFNSDDHWFVSPDGQKVSTEGDWEIVTAYMNQKYGTDMYSANMLNIPLSHVIHPRSLTDTGMKWAESHTDLLGGTLSRTGMFLMPDYANVNAPENFSFAAREKAIDAGYVQLYDDQDIKGAIETRLLQAEYRKIELEAARLFGADEDLEGEDRQAKDNWTYNEKFKAKGIYERGVIPESVTTNVREQLLNWKNFDFSQYSLNPDELATVRAIQWYTQLHDAALANLQKLGVTHLGLKGGNDQERGALAAARSDIMQTVESQIAYGTANGVDMGNFVYLYYRYLLSELDPEQEDDPLLDLAETMQFDLSAYTRN